MDGKLHLQQIQVPYHSEQIPTQLVTMYLPVQTHPGPVLPAHCIPLTLTPSVHCSSHLYISV